MSQHREHTPVDQRLARLEARLKMLTLLSVMALATILVAFVGQPQGQEVSARSFVIVDEDGVEVARFGLRSPGDSLPRLTLGKGVGTGPVPQSQTILGPDGVTVYGREAGTFGVMASHSFLVTGNGGQIQLDANDSGPAITLQDKVGFLPRTRAVLGRINLAVLTTGSTESRAPASLVLFDQEGNVIWEAPR